jgi:hypothetical protein
LEQVTPETPAIDHEAAPVGVAEPDGPDTVAVKMKVEPRTAVGAPVVTMTVGNTLETVKPKALLGPTGE